MGKRMKSLSLILLLIFFPCLSFAQSLNPEAAIDALLDALAPLDQLQGEFTQRQYGSQGELLAESSGTFRLLRPGYFSWEIQQPDRQLIIAGPEYLWHHDRDLETATRRPVTTGAEWTPLQILGGDGSALRENFAVVQLETGRFELTPLMPQMGFKQLNLTLDAASLKQMVIDDTLDQSVVIDFTPADSGVTLTASDFAFNPPAEADLFYHDE